MAAATSRLCFNFPTLCCETKASLSECPRQASNHNIAFPCQFSLHSGLHLLPSSTQSPSLILYSSRRRSRAFKLTCCAASRDDHSESDSVLDDTVFLNDPITRSSISQSARPRTVQTDSDHVRKEDAHSQSTSRAETSGQSFSFAGGGSWRSSNPLPLPWSSGSGMQGGRGPPLASLGQVFGGSGGKTEHGMTADALKALQSKLQQETEEARDARVNLYMQREREVIQEHIWKRRIWRAMGRLKGTQWDPLPGTPMRFSDFWRLVNQNRVQYMEYGDYGEHVAVILPHVAEGAPSDVKYLARRNGSYVPPNEFVWRKHKVEKMPANVQTEMWQQLRPHLVHLQPVYPSSPWLQMRPVFAVAVVYAMRILLAAAFFRFVDKRMLPIYKETPVMSRPDFLSGGSAGDLAFEIRGALGILGESRARFISAEERTGVTFDDFAGQDHIKEEMIEVMRILKDDTGYKEFKVYPPKGVLLHGPPGTGKTLLARAIAGEAGLPFFSASGSEFVEMFKGVAAARVKDLFQKARQYSPSIIFIDEIDALGLKRGSEGIDGGAAEREQGLIQLLTELDGFVQSESRVLVIGATNRIDMLDPALMRKGRFDRVLAVTCPGPEGRLQILKVHADNKAFASAEEKERLLTEIADFTAGYSGAELMNILNEASILTVRHNKEFIEIEELKEACDRQEGRFKSGIEDIVESSEEVRLRMAYRESSVALLECFYPSPEKTLARTSLEVVCDETLAEFKGGDHKVLTRKADMLIGFVKTLAPAVAEEMIFGTDQVTFNSGAYYSAASQLAEFMILQSGLTALGLISINSDVEYLPHYGPKVMALRDRYVQWAKETCTSIIRERRPAFENIAQALLAKGELTGEEIRKIYDESPSLPQPPVAEVDEYAALMEAGRWGIHGLSLPGRATFAPGNTGFATFGAPRPNIVSPLPSEVWRSMDRIREKKIDIILHREENQRVVEEKKAAEKGVLLKGGFL